MADRLKKSLRAEQAGKLFERLVGETLHVFGCQFDCQVVVGQNPLYGRKWRADFVLTNLPEFSGGLILEAKAQNRRGSVDVKFPYLLASIREVHRPTIVVASGPWLRDASAWLRRQCDGETLIAVFDFEEFVSWLRNLELT